MSLSTMLSGHRTDAVLDSIVSNSLCSIMVTQAKSDTPIVYVNEAFTELTGYTATEVLGKSPRLLQGPKTDQKVLDRLREDLAAGRVFEGQAINYRNDCSEFDMFWRVFPVLGENSKPAYFVALQQTARG